MNRNVELCKFKPNSGEINNFRRQIRRIHQKFNYNVHPDKEQSY